MSYEANLLALSIAMQARVPVFIWGTPGSAKTKTIEAVARGLNEPVCKIEIGTREATDIVGLPRDTEEGVVLRAHKWAREISARGHGVLFFDDYSFGALSTQAATLRVINELVVGEHKLPDETMVVAAGNPPGTAAGAHYLGAAAANRFLHLYWTSSAQAFSRGMRAGWPSMPVELLPANWRQRIPKMRSLVADFIDRKPELLDRMPSDMKSQGGPFCSQRSWDLLTCPLLAAADSLGHNPKSAVAGVLIRGCIGDAQEANQGRGTPRSTLGPASEFLSYISNLDLRDPEEYLRDPIRTPLPARQDQILATLNAVVSSAIDRSYTAHQQTERFHAALRFIARIIRERAPDLVIAPFHLLSNNAPEDGYIEPPADILELEPFLAQTGIDFSRKSR